MLPLLQLLSGGEERRFGDLVPILEEQFQLDSDERSQMLPSGRITTFRSRLHWAATYLAHSEILVRPARGWLQITQRGSRVLVDQPKNIDVSFLNQFPEFVQWRAKSGANVERISKNASTKSVSSSALSPEEALESSYRTLRDQLAEDLLLALKSVTPKFFEHIVIDLLVAMGYGGSRLGVAEAIGMSGDGGIDGVINEDKLGLDVVYVQAKRWQDSVGRPTVQAFTGSLEGHHATKGVIITTSTFTKEAVEFVRFINKRVVLIDGERLADYMIDHNVGVSPLSTFIVKRIDNDYFEES